MTNNTSKRHHKIPALVYQILSSYSNVEWNELYLMLFRNACKSGNIEVAYKAFYKIITEGIRTKNNWALEELVENKEDIRSLVDLNLDLFAKDAIKEIIPEKYKRTINKYFEQEYAFSRSFDFQFREGSQYSLCACCHEFVLTCEEIQSFPLINEEKYIRDKFNLALTQDQIHKRTFIIDRLIIEYGENNPDLSLFFEMWEMVENVGIHISPNGFIDQIGERILEKEFFTSFLSISRFRHREHDNIIDEVIELLLVNKQYDKACYLNAKLSTPYLRLFYALSSVLNADTEDDEAEDQMIRYLDKVIKSIRNEEVIDD